MAFKKIKKIQKAQNILFSQFVPYIFPNIQTNSQKKRCFSIQQIKFFV